MAILNTKLISLDNLKRFGDDLKIFKKINVGGKTIVADNLKSELTFISGSNINISADETTKKITIDGAYTTFGGSGSTAKTGLVPSPGTTAGSQKYLCEDGTWAIPDASRFQKTTGVGYFSIGDTTCTVSITIPTNNYTIQIYGTNPDMVVTGVTVGSNSMVVSMNKQTVAGAVYIITTEAEYPSATSTEVTGVGTYNAGDTSCNITIDLPTGNYAVSAHTTVQNVYINNITHTGTTMTVNFFGAQPTAGSVYVIARKVD